MKPCHSSDDKVQALRLSTWVKHCILEGGHMLPYHQKFQVFDWALQQRGSTGKLNINEVFTHRLPPLASAQISHFEKRSFKRSVHTKHLVQFFDKYWKLKPLGNFLYFSGILLVRCFGFSSWVCTPAVTIMGGPTLCDVFILFWWMQEGLLKHGYPPRNRIWNYGREISLLEYPWPYRKSRDCFVCFLFFIYLFLADNPFKI